MAMSDILSTPGVAGCHHPRRSGRPGWPATDGRRAALCGRSVRGGVISQEGGLANDSRRSSRTRLAWHQEESAGTAARSVFQNILGNYSTDVPLFRKFRKIGKFKLCFRKYVTILSLKARLNNAHDFEV